MNRKSRIALFMLAAFTVAALAPAAALGVNYWGYNWMSSVSPTGACVYGTDGSACTGTTSVSSQADKLDGGAGCVWVGYHAGQGIVWCSQTTQTISAFSSLGNSPAVGAKCKWFSGGASYVQCRYFNGFAQSLDEGGVNADASTLASRSTRALEMLPTHTRTAIQVSGFAGALGFRRVVGTMDAIYSFRNAAGSTCWATGPAAQCAGRSTGLLTTSPIADMMSVPDVRLDATPRMLWWRGITTAAVKTVVLIDRTGVRHTAKVVNQSFSIDGSFTGRIRQLALDAAGRTIWTRSSEAGRAY